MKHILFIIGCILLSFGLHSQTNEDYVLFEKINQHRNSLGLNKLSWDTAAYKMACYHAKYLAIINSPTYNKYLITHDESFDIPNFSEMSFEERYKNFIKGDCKFIRENCAGNSVPSDFGRKPSKLTDLIFNSWLKSKDGHKENMENPNTTKGACHIEYLKINAVLSSGKTVQISYAVTVLDIY